MGSSGAFSSFRQGFGTVNQAEQKIAHIEAKSRMKSSRLLHDSVSVGEQFSEIGGSEAYLLNAVFLFAFVDD